MILKRIRAVLLQYYIILVNSNEYKLISQYQSGSVLYDTWLFGKNFTWYIQPQENRQIPLVNDYYTVNEWCATFNSHKAYLFSTDTEIQ